MEGVERRPLLQCRAMGYACVSCGGTHEWGNEPDGYHMMAFTGLGRIQNEEAIVLGDLKVAFENKGWGGEYDPKSPEEDNLLRIYVYLRAGEAGEPYWEKLEAGSICTGLLTTTAAETRKRILESVFKEVAEAVSREQRNLPSGLMDKLALVNEKWPEHGNAI